MTAFLMPPRDGDNFTAEQLESYRRDLEDALGLPVQFRSPDGRTRRRVPVPLRVRAQARTDRFCAWLCGRGLWRTARAIWRATGSRM